MTLVRKPTPYPSESLAGLIARAAGMNIYPRAYDVLVQAGLGATRPTSLALKDRGYAKKLAEVLGVDASTVIPLFHGAADRGGRFDFFGIKLRTIHREPSIRRVSPRALSKAPYIRAIWHIRPFSFDPETHELLLSHCPVCSTQLGFNRTRGVAFCDVCEGPDRFGFPSPTVDLRDFPQTLVEVDDMEALDFVTSLVDPNPDVRNNYAPALAEELSGLDRADLFEMVLAVAAAIEMNADPDFVPSPEMYRAGTRQVEPAVLAAAGRAVLQWPDGFLRLTTEARLGASKRPGLWGVLKELGALGMLPRDAHIAPAVAALFEQAHRRYFATSRPIEGVVRRADYRDEEMYIGAKQLRKLAEVGVPLVTKLGNHPDVFKMRLESANKNVPAPVMFDTWQIAKILRDYRDLESEGVIVTRFGIPNDGVRDIEASGLLKRARGTAISLAAPDVYYSKQNFIELYKIMWECIELRPNPKGFIPLSEAMLMFPTGHRPWLPVLEEIWQGRVEAVYHKHPSKSLLSALSVKDLGSRRPYILQGMRQLKRHDIGSVTTAVANLMLGIYDYNAFSALVEAKLLSIDDDGKVPYAQVLQLASRYIFANESGVRSNRPTSQVRGWLSAHGVLPAHELQAKGGLMFERSAVEPLLEMQA